MESVSPMDSWWVFTLPAILGFSNSFDPFLLCSIVLAIFFLALLTWAITPGGRAWRHGRTRTGRTPIPGPIGLPVLGSLHHLSRGLAHRTLASMASTFGATKLMAFSLGSTPVVVSSDPQIAKEILTSPHFAGRPIKQSARKLMFSRALGFAPNGTYWRLLRRIASSHLFAPKRIAAHEAGRQLDCEAMLLGIVNEQTQRGAVVLRDHLQAAALNNVMGSVFGKRYEVGHETQELINLREMVKEGFDLLGAFNWSDFLPWLSFFYDPFCINQRCAALVPKVRKFVRGIIEEHRLRGFDRLSDNADFVDVLLLLEGEEKLEEDDMIAVLWEMIFRGTDTTAFLTEWVMAELVLNQQVQAKLRQELDMVVGVKTVRDADVANLPYLQAVIKETLRIHPPGPLLSWARLSTLDVHLSNGMVVPAQTTAMVNMWSITHDPTVWEDPLIFRPERFMENDIDIKGTDLRLAPFGAGRRVCPGKNLGMVTVSLWVAKLIHNFKWVSDPQNPIDLTEILKLSCEVKSKLTVVAIPRNDVLCPSLI